MHSANDKDHSLKSFVVSEDPALTADIGDTWRFAWVKPTFAVQPRFARPSNWHMFEGAVLAVMFSTKQDNTILGSAVMVAPGIALSVNHVLEDYIPKLVSGDASLMCVGIATHGTEAWKLRYVTLVDKTDISILSLEYMAQLPPHRIFHAASMTTRTPGIGESLFMAGFRSDEMQFERRTGQAPEFRAGLLIASGVVTDVYASGRGVSKPWPAIAVDCPTVGGMSGGPVFDSRGLVVGLVSSSLDTGHGSEPSPTFVALNWPALSPQFPGIWPNMPQVAGRKSLIDLATSFAICDIERPDAVESTTTDGVTVTAYSSWS